MWTETKTKKTAELTGGRYPRDFCSCLLRWIELTWRAPSEGMNERLCETTAIERAVTGKGCCVHRYWSGRCREPWRFIWTVYEQRELVRLSNSLAVSKGPYWESTASITACVEGQLFCRRRCSGFAFHTHHRPCFALLLRIVTQQRAGLCHEAPSIWCVLVSTNRTQFTPVSSLFRFLLHCNAENHIVNTVLEEISCLAISGGWHGCTCRLNKKKRLKMENYNSIAL